MNKVDMNKFNTGNSRPWKSVVKDCGDPGPNDTGSFFSKNSIHNKPNKPNKPNTPNTSYNNRPRNTNRSYNDRPRHFNRANRHQRGDQRRNNNRNQKYDNKYKKRPVSRKDLDTKLEGVLSGNMRLYNFAEWREAFKLGIIQPDSVINKASKTDGKIEEWSVLQMLAWYLMHRELKCCLDEVGPKTTGLSEDGNLVALIDKREKVLGEYNENTGKELKATRKVIESFTFPRRLTIEINREKPDKNKLVKIIGDSDDHDFITAEIIKRVSNGVMGLKNNEFSHGYLDKYACFMVAVNEVFQEIDKSYRPLKRLLDTLFDHVKSPPESSIVSKEQIPQIISRFFGRLIGYLGKNTALCSPVLKYIMEFYTPYSINRIVQDDENVVISSFIFIETLPELNDIPELLQDLVKAVLDFVQKMSEKNGVSRYKCVLFDKIMRSECNVWKNKLLFDMKDDYPIEMFLNGWKKCKRLPRCIKEWVYKSGVEKEKQWKKSLKEQTVPENAVNTIEKLEKLESIDILSPDIEDYEAWDVIEEHVRLSEWSEAREKIHTILPGEEWRLVMVALNYYVYNNKEGEGVFDEVCKHVIFLDSKSIVQRAARIVKDDLLLDIQDSKKEGIWKNVISKISS